MRSIKKKIKNRIPFERKRKNGFQRNNILHIRKTPDKKREVYLDCIKGFACIMMIFAHFPEGDFFGLKHFFGDFAPFLFFAATGISTRFALERKKRFWGLILIYIIFFFLTLSCNFMRRPEELINFQNPFLNFDFFQIIALGSILSFILHKLKLGIASSVSLFLLIIALHFYNQIHPFNFGGRILFSPGIFTIIPWISIFILGYFFEKIPRNKIFFLNFLLIIFTIFSFSISHSLRSFVQFTKWNMDIFYLVLGVASWSLSFSFFRLLENEKFKMKFLALLGKYSVIFVYAHFFIKKIMDYFGGNFEKLSDFELVAWGSVFSLSFTIFLAFTFNAFNKNISIKKPLKFFVILFFLPFLPILQNQIFITIYYFIYGILFFVKFRELSNEVFSLTKKLDSANTK